MSDNRPNVLWICTDQQRYDTLGCYGNDLVDTPAIDRLADDGVRFSRCFSQNPVCTPSRASFLTGRYPRTTRCRQNGQPMPRSERLLPRRLAEAGYECGLVGKLHLSPTNADDDANAQEEPARRIKDGYGSFTWSPAAGDPRPANEYRQWLRKQGVEFDPTPVRDSEYVSTSVSPEYHQTVWAAQTAETFVETMADDDRPWCYSVNLFDPHHPFDPPRSYLERYLDDLEDVPLPNADEEELAEKPAVQRQAAEQGALSGPEMDDEDHRLVRAAYYAMVDLIDDAVDHMLTALDCTGQRDSTLVVFHSDHGEMLGDHGIYKKGPYFYEPAIRVPLVFSWPDALPSGEETDALVELADLAPTIADAAGLDRAPGTQARSLWPRLAGDEPLDAHREDVYCEFYNASRRHTDPPRYATMVRTDRYKYVRHHGDGQDELYDLREEPLERHNHVDDPDFRDIHVRLLGRLADRTARTVDPLPERAGAW